jgi:hypothetical protein
MHTRNVGKMLNARVAQNLSCMLCVCFLKLVLHALRVPPQTGLVCCSCVSSTLHCMLCMLFLKGVLHVFVFPPAFFCMCCACFPKLVLHACAHAHASFHPITQLTFTRTSHHPSQGFPQYLKIQSQLLPKPSPYY